MPPRSLQMIVCQSGDAGLLAVNFWKKIPEIRKSTMQRHKDFASTAVAIINANVIPNR